MAYDARLGEALDDVDALGGYRVFIHLPGGPSDAEALAFAVPWVEGGVVRPGTMLRVFVQSEAVLLVTGGALTERDLVALLAVRQAIAEQVTTMWVVPPPGAPRQVFEELARRDLLPPEPPRRHYHPWAMRAAALTFFVPSAFARKLGIAFSITLLFAAVGVVLFVASYFWQIARDGEDDEPDVRIAQRWYPLSLLRG